MNFVIQNMFSNWFNQHFPKWSWNSWLKVIQDIYDNYNFTSQVSRVAQIIKSLYEAMPPWLFYLDAFALLIIIVLVILRIVIDLL